MGENVVGSREIIGEPGSNEWWEVEWWFRGIIMIWWTSIVGIWCFTKNNCVINASFFRYAEGCIPGYITDDYCILREGVKGD